MIDPNQANRAHNVASAIAGFQLADFVFATLVKNGILPKAEAEQMLKRLIAANKTGGPGNRAAAELLATVWKNLSKFQPATRQ